jgi:MYXO-CTERM domain-containing protein
MTLKYWLACCATLGLFACSNDPSERDLGRARSALSQVLSSETEPNAAAATATALSLDANGVAVVRADISPMADHDYYSFTASTNDRIYAATMTGFSATTTGDSELDLFGSDGTTLIETDDEDGTFAAAASVIAGATIPSNGTYYLRVKHFSVAANSQIRPYDLHFQRRSGSATVETEPNDSPGETIASSKWVSGSLSSAADVDAFQITLAAGDTVYASLDLDPERDTTTWNGTLELGPFGGSYLAAADGNETSPNGEALFASVRDAGTYAIRVRAAAATFGTYHLNVAVRPRATAAAGSTCTTYASTNVPQTINDGPSLTSSSLAIPAGAGRIHSMEVALDITHDFMSDLDATLTAPTGNTVVLFSDVGNSTNTAMNLVLDDTAAVPVGLVGSSTVGMHVTPEATTALYWFDGQAAAGVWNLNVFDDAANDGGTLNNWSIRICTMPAADTTCPAGTLQATILDADFEANAEGFTHSGTLDEWERGTPASLPINSCASGSNCWKTDLDGTYDVDSNQDLLSPALDLSNAVGPIWISWMQQYHLEQASFDHASVVAQEVGGANPSTLWQWTGADMTTPVGSAATPVAEAAGWGLHRARLDSFAGENTQVKFHLDSNSSNVFGGLAIDDVMVTACRYECGDGELYNAGLGGTEECDDGNTDNGDGCSDTCQDESSIGGDAGSVDAGSDAGPSGDASTGSPNGGSPNDAAAGGGAPNSNGQDAAAGNANGGSPFGGGDPTNSDDAGSDTGSAVTPAAGDDGGCGCKVPGSHRQSPWTSVLLVGMALSLAARRRRR